MESVKISKGNVVDSNFSYKFSFGEWDMYMDGYWIKETAEPGYEIILCNGDTDREICILEGGKDIKPESNLDAWLIIQNKAHTVLRNIWKL